MLLYAHAACALALACERRATPPPAVSRAVNWGVCPCSDTWHAQDIEVSQDFFSYFTATAKLLDAEPSLLCVSAFNDNGQGQYAGDPQALHRSDFFPGLVRERRLS